MVGSVSDERVERTEVDQFMDAFGPVGGFVE